MPNETYLQAFPKYSNPSTEAQILQFLNQAVVLDYLYPELMVQVLTALEGNPSGEVFAAISSAIC